MEKIKLSEEEKQILLSLKDVGRYDIDGQNQDYLISLEQFGFINGPKAMSGNFIAINLTDYGKTYLLKNPKLTNPSIWDDKKYLINTIISIFAVIISAIALYFSLKK